MKAISKILFVGLSFLFANLSARAQDFIYINDNNFEQSGTPTKSFQFVKEVRLTNFNVNGANGPWYAKPADVKNAPQTLDKNFVRVETIIKPEGVSTEAEISDLTVDQKSTSYSYLDGVGRSIQEVNQKGSPAKKDVVKFNVYENPFGREVYKYMDYVSKSSNGSYKENPVSEQSAFYLTGGGISVDQKPYTKNVFDDSPLNQIKKNYSPGWSWHNDGGDNKPVESILKLNNATEIQKLLFVEGGLPTVSGYHEPNTLQVTETIDEDGQVKRTYTNFRGQVIVERVGSGLNWNDTYNVYDYVGNLIYVFSPEASTRFSEYTASSNKQLFLDLWAFQYKYDEHGRLIAKRIPGYEPTTTADLNIGWYSIIYDRWDRIVLTQEPKQYSSNEWTFTKYDVHNRPIMTGIITGNKSTLKTSAQNSTVHHEDRLSTNAIGYTNNSFPSHSDANLVIINYYDDYAFRNYTGWDAEGFSYTAFDESGIVDRSKIFTESTFVKGYATGSKVKILDASPAKWLNTVTYYDKRYNVVQTISENQLGGLDKVSTLFDQFTGRAKVAKRSHTSTGNSLTIVEKYYYDHAQRLTKVTHQINSMPEIVLVSNKYNELGQLIEKNVHSSDNGANFLQSVDMRYNIKGWITHINNSTLTNDGINNDDSNDLFGMEILYNEAPNINNGAIMTKKMYDGNISAIKWKTITQPEEKIYGFNYDVFKRFKKAYYATKNGSNWTGNAGKFNEEVTVYDKNGNIVNMDHPSSGAGLMRNGVSNGNSVEIDKLFYRYDGNQLKNVHDGATNSMGFTDKGSVQVDEYQYDANGNLTEDQNKFITNVSYNYLNRPKDIEITRVDLNNRIDRIKYTYDALGNKLSKEILIGGVSKWKTEYVGSIQYDKAETGAYKISFLNTSEGRAVNNGSDYDYEYFLSDHQKNVRVVFGLKKEAESYKATMEELSVDLKNYEENTFKNIAASRLSIGNTSLNYTEPSENTLAPNQSAKTNAHAGQAIGPAKYLRVLNGDAVYMETYAKYQQPTLNNATIAAAILGAAVTTTFSIPAERTTLINGINSNAALAAGSVVAGTDQPKAYLVYLFFDDNDVYQGGGASGISSTAHNQFQKLSRSFTADRNGHLYIYLANESNVSTADVYFDDFYIIHQKNNTSLQVVQASDYYPYGLSFNEYHADRLRTVSPGVHEPILRNRYLFQGQEVQKDLDVDWYHYTFRMHDPGMGRFVGVDPIAEKYMYNSTYAFSENRLIEGIELEGAELLNTIKRFEFMDNPISYPITYVNNFGVDLANFGIGLWNAGFQSGSTIYNHGFNSYLSGLKSEAIDLGLGIKHKVISDFNYVTGTSWDQQRQGMWTAAKQPQSYQNAFSTSLSLLLTKQVSFSAATPNVAPTTKFVAPSGAQYSVAYEMKLPTDLLKKGYTTHFQAANTSLSNAIASDANFAKAVADWGIVIPRKATGAISGTSPTNWVWHHDVGTGIMQLVPKIQHNNGSMFWGTLHPGGRGGMAIWGPGR